MKATLRRERVVAIDALRGVALFGILLVNVQFFQGPEPFLAFDGGQVWEGADRVAALLISAFVEGKFITAFAFLFGLGIAIQSDRAEASGRRSGPLLVRRLAVLAVLGAIHAVFIWYGDVLFTYALLGFVLLAFRHRAPRTLVIWAVALYAVVALLFLATAAVSVPADAEAVGTEAVNRLAEDGVRAYQSGSYPRMLGQRVGELGYTVASFPIILPWTLASMLLGMAALRAGIATDLRAHERLLRRVAVVGIAVGLPLSLLAAASGGGASLVVPAIAPLLSLGYLALGARLFDRAADAPVTRTFASVGRMALTNYLSQSVICTAVYYGLGLYGRGTLLAALALTAAVWVFNVAFSTWWLSRFDQGPVEWLWRRLTYGRVS